MHPASAACIRRAQLTSGERSLHPETARSPKQLDGRPILNFLRVHTSELLMFLREVKPICRSHGAQFLNSVVNGCPRLYIATLLIDVFRCRHNVSCSGGHEPDSLTMTTGKGFSSFTPIKISVAVPILFCARTCHRLYAVVLVYYCALRALLCAIPRY